MQKRGPLTLAHDWPVRVLDLIMSYKRGCYNNRVWLPLGVKTLDSPLKSLSHSLTNSVTNE